MSLTDRLVPSLYSQLDLDELASHTVKLLSSLIQCDMMAYSEVNPELRRSVNALDSAESQAKAQMFEPVFDRYMHEHPLINHLMEHPSSGVIRISDFLTTEQWHSTGLHRQRQPGTPEHDALCRALPLHRVSGLPAL